MYRCLNLCWFWEMLSFIMSCKEEQLVASEGSGTLACPATCNRIFAHQHSLREVCRVPISHPQPSQPPPEACQILNDQLTRHQPSSVGKELNMQGNVLPASTLLELGPEQPHLSAAPVPSPVCSDVSPSPAVPLKPHPSASSRC